MDSVLENAYKEYFNHHDDCDNNLPYNESSEFKDGVVTGINENYKKNSEKIGKCDECVGSIDNDRLISDGFICSVHDACDEIRKLLNIILGQGWGDFTPEQSGHHNVNNIPMPSIRYSVNLREVSDHYGPKPKLIDSKKEYANGVATGDAFDIYKHAFDCIVEFNIRDHTSQSCAALSNKFEEILALHTGLLKRRGISEISFLKEVPAKYSPYHTESIPMITLYYYIRIERTYFIKHSTIKDLELKMLHEGEHSI